LFLSFKFGIILKGKGVREAAPSG